MGRSSDTLDLSVEILSSLANSDSLRIFLACHEGIESSTRTIEEIGLTQKRYYTWLKRLIDAGLVEKRESAYVQTMLGKFCHRMGRALLNAIEKRDQLELADKLMKADTFSTKDKEEILHTISKSDLIGIASLSDIIHEVKMIGNRDDLISDIVGLIGNAKESAYIAVRGADERVLSAVATAVERGVRFSFLGSGERQFSEDMQTLRMIFTPALIKTMQKLISSKEISLRLIEELPYSFYVVDEEYGVVELPSPVYDDFCVAFEFRNEIFCRELVSAFNLLYEKGSEYPVIEFVEKYSTLYK
jgi:DNA-binding MarR family transcriptional regulator